MYYDERGDESSTASTTSTDSLLDFGLGAGLRQRFSEVKDAVL